MQERVASHRGTEAEYHSKELGEHRVTIQNRAGTEKRKKNEGRWQEKKETEKKTQLNGKVIQNRQGATSYKNDNIFIWGEISS